MEPSAAGGMVRSPGPIGAEPRLVTLIARASGLVPHPVQEERGAIRVLGARRIPYVTGTPIDPCVRPPSRREQEEPDVVRAAVVRGVFPGPVEREDAFAAGEALRRLGVPDGVDVLGEVAGLDPRSRCWAAFRLDGVSIVAPSFW